MSDVATDDFTVSGEDDAAQSGAIAAAADAAASPESGDSDGDVSAGSTLDEADEELASEAGKTLAKKKGSYQARLNELTITASRAERERDEARAEAARLKAEREAPAEKTETKVEAPTYYTRPEPNEDEIGTTYASYGDYVKDLVKWQRAELDAERDKQSRETEASRTAREVMTQAQARIDAFKANHPDYEDVTAAAKFPAGTSNDSAVAIFAHLQHSELGPSLAYELAKNPTEFARIAALPSARAIAALGKLEGVLEARQGAAKSGPASDDTTTNAKRPIKPVGASSPVTSDDDEDADDLSPAAVDRYIRKQNAKDLAARRR